MIALKHKGKLSQLSKFWLFGKTWVKICYQQQPKVFYFYKDNFEVLKILVSQTLINVAIMQTLIFLNLLIISLILWSLFALNSHLYPVHGFCITSVVVSFPLCLLIFILKVHPPPFSCMIHYHCRHILHIMFSL